MTAHHELMSTVVTSQTVKKLCKISIKYMYRKHNPGTKILKLSSSMCVFFQCLVRRIFFPLIFFQLTFLGGHQICMSDSSTCFEAIAGGLYGRSPVQHCAVLYCVT